MKKLRDFLNRDIKEFNVKLLVLSGVLFIALMGFISYKLTNNSYALFTDTVTGTKTLTFNYTEDVYRYGTEKAYKLTPLAAGTYNGYCYVKTSSSGYTENSCTDYNYGYLTQAQCQTAINSWGGSSEGYSCESGMWTTSGVTYTNDATTLNKRVYLKYNVGAQTDANESYVCYTINNEEYCLIGGDGVYDTTLEKYVTQSYDVNKEIMDDSFGSSNCHENSGSNPNNLCYECSLNSLSAFAYPGGYVGASFRVDSSYIYICSIFGRGNSYCS